MATPGADLQRELEALERVLFRLASADDARLLLVLQALLPQLLRTFPATAATATDALALQLQEKILQVIAHVKTRLQALASPAMPLRALAQVLREPAASAFAHTFAFMFIDIGFRAASADEREEVLAEIFAALESYSASQQETFYRLLVRALPITGSAVYPPPKPADPLPAESAEDSSPTTSGQEMDPGIVGSMEALLDFLLDFVLHDGSSSSSTDATVFGLSIPRLERLQRVVAPEAFTKERLYTAQLNALRFVKELEIPTKHKVVHYLAGCASFHHSIKSFCEEQLVHVLKHEYAQLEDPQVVRRIIALCLGSQVAQGSGAFSGHEQLALSNRTRFADASILQALALLSESKAATNAMPMMLQLLCHLMYGAESARPQNVANRVKLAGVRLCHWTFIHTESAFVDGFLGPVMFPTLLRVLMDPNADSDPSQLAFMREFRQGVYDTLTVIGARAPAIVAGSEQAFQVLLVRCLVEEERRTGTGANALKAFTSLSHAYGLKASEATQAKVRSELTDLLSGSRVFDPTKNYARVRAAIATWCGDLLLNASTGDSNIAMRFALLKLCGDPDAEVQTLSRKALYTEPLPALSVVSVFMRTQYPHPDLKNSVQDARTVESCLRFCLSVLKSSHRAGDMEIGDERSAMIAYFVQTLLGKSAAAGVSGDAAARSGMYEAAASSLVEISAFDTRSVTSALGQSMDQLLDAACISSDRDFLQHIAALVQCTLVAEDCSQDCVVDEVVQSISLKLDDPGMQSKHVACLQYVLGSAISVLSESEDAVSDDQMKIVLAAYKKMASLLAVMVKTCSQFVGFPRGEEDQNARVDFLRSLLDGIGLSGSLTKFLLNASFTSEWVEFKRQSLGVLQQVIEWNLSGISSDGALKLKLMKIKYVAIESLGRAISGLPIENAAYREVSNLAADIGDPELMYALLYLSTTDPIWETLLGTSSASTSARHALFSFAEVDRVFRQSIIEKAGKLWMDESYANTNKLVPWLYLLKFHSNPKVSEVMTNLWNFAKGKFVTTSTQEKTLLQQHWRVIFQFLLSRVEGSRNFKYREAACVALIDILNGADADQLRDEFLHLWKLASAAVDDVMEAVCLVGLKLYRYMGELSLRIAANDEACRKILLQYLISDGIVSKNVVCRALGIDILLRLVKALAAEAIQESLAALILKLLEYLSSLEMPELQYAQFHVQKKEQLERLRVSISQSGPVGQLLELSTTRLKELAGSNVCVKIVDELARGVANLLRFGVGLNTRVGSANFVVSLAVELPFELRKCKGAELLLTKVFIPFVSNKTSAENDVYGDEESRYGVSSGGLADGLVIQTYCRAAAYLCPLVDAPLVREYVRAGIFAYNRNKRPANGGASNEGGGVESTLQQSDANRFLLVTAIATKELVSKIPPIADASAVVQADSRNDWYCTHVFPGAFIGQFASTEVLKSTWTTVLEELPPSVLYAEASIDATLASVALFIAHTAWDTRKQAALALHALFSSTTSSYRSRITAQQTERIWRDLVEAVPGRLWKGKGVILEALVALTSVKHEEREALSKLLLCECERAWKNREMEYLESAIQSFGKLSSQLPAEQWELRLANFSALRSAFLRWLGGRAVDGRTSPEDEDVSMQSVDSGVGSRLPPLMIKCVFESLALVWPSTPLEGSAGEALATDMILWLCETTTRSEFNVWSIRKAVFEALSAVIASAPAKTLATQQTVGLVLDKCCGEYGVRDAKYSMIRVAAASGLVALTKRHKTHHDLALLLTVHRERISETLEVLRASEEPAEQRAAFQTMTNLLELQQ